METLQFPINGEIYSATPIESADQVLYEIRLDYDLLCVIGLNENGRWEANNDFDEHMVQQLGTLIELNDE